MVKKGFWVIRGLFYKLIFKEFGNMSYIGKPIIIIGVKNISIKNKVRIFPGARIECNGKNSNIVINENTSIGQNIHMISYGNLFIGKNTTISGNVFITNIDHEYRKRDIHILDQEHIVKDTIIGENCFIGYGASIQAGTKLGKQCIVGTNAVVRGEFPDYCVIAGVPAKIIKKYNHNTMKWEKYNG